MRHTPSSVPSVSLYGGVSYRRISKNEVRTKDFLDVDGLHASFFSASILSHCADVCPVPFAFLWVIVGSEIVALMASTKHSKHFNFTILLEVGFIFGLFFGDETTVDDDCSTVGTDERLDQMVAVLSVVHSGTEKNSMSVIPLSPHDDFAVGKVCNRSSTTQSLSANSMNLGLRIHLIRRGSTSGSRDSFSCSSSMRFTFHLSRSTCQVPSAKVNIGMIPSRTIAGLKSEYCFVLYCGAVELAVVDSVLFLGILWRDHPLKDLKDDPENSLCRSKDDIERGGGCSV